jgi:hypothetical protein
VLWDDGSAKLQQLPILGNAFTGSCIQFLAVTSKRGEGQKVGMHLTPSLTEGSSNNESGRNS